MRILPMARRFITSFLQWQSTQIALQERYLRRQRPWQPDWLQWTGKRLTGTLIPLDEVEIARFSRR